MVVKIRLIYITYFNEYYIDKILHVAQNINTKKISSLAITKSKTCVNDRNYNF